MEGILYVLGISIVFGVVSYIFNRPKPPERVLKEDVKQIVSTKTIEL